MNKFFLIVLLAFVMTGCQSYKKVPYLQDAEAVSYTHLKESYIKLSGIKESSKLTAINNMLSFPYEMNNYQKKKQLRCV